MPDITPAQISAALVALLTALVVLFKLNVSDTDMAVIVGAIGTVTATAWAIADSIIRHGRAAVVVARIEKGLPETPPPPA